MLLIPPSLTLILRHRFDRVCGDVLFTFFAWTHCVASPNMISPTLFTSATNENLRNLRKYSSRMQKCSKVLRKRAKLKKFCGWIKVVHNWKWKTWDVLELRTQDITYYIYLHAFKIVNVTTKLSIKTPWKLTNAKTIIGKLVYKKICKFDRMGEQTIYGCFAGESHNDQLQARVCVLQVTKHRLHLICTGRVLAETRLTHYWHASIIRNPL